MIVALIANTTTRAGLKIRAELDTSTYPTSTKVSDEALAAVNLQTACLPWRLELHTFTSSLDSINWIRYFDAHPYRWKASCSKAKSLDRRRPKS